MKGYNISTPFVSLTPDGVLTLRAGYAWDGASGPTFDTPAVMLAALLHDALYQLATLEKSPKFKRYADAMLYAIMRANGSYCWRARVWQWMVNKFGTPQPRKETAIPAELPVGWAWAAPMKFK